MKKDILIATNLSLITGLGLSACKAVGIAPFSPTPESGANSHEFTPTPESDIYPTHFAWIDGRNEVVQKVMAEYGLSSSDIKGFEITVSGLLSATDVHDEKVQFINFIDPNTGLNVSAYYDSKNPNGLLNDFETINRGGGLFVERQLVDLNDPNNYHTLLIIPINAEEKLKSGESTTIEFNPPEWVRAYMPALDPSKNLVINVPIIPELTTTASLGIIPEFLVIDGSVEGIQTPTPSPESLLPPEMTEKYLNRFESTENGTKAVNGVDTNVIYGIRANGEKHVIAMEIEIDGEMRMTRVGEYTDEAGFSYYTYIDPKNSVEGRFAVNGETSKRMFDYEQSVNIWKSLGQQWGKTPEQARDYAMVQKGGIVNFNTPVRDFSVGGWYPFRYESITVNFNLPIEIAVNMTNEGFNSMPTDIKKRMLFGSDFTDRDVKFDPETGDIINKDIFISSSLIWVNSKGALVIVAYDTASLERPALLNPSIVKQSEYGELKSKLNDLIASSIMVNIHFLGNRNLSVPTSVGYANSPFDYFEIDIFAGGSSQ